ncbi:MAG: hypothetical protein JJU36_16645 [Phycisphaeraceae bacterium]|nr:hypothetical protein [Phycisphaeraceae bacterium]
MLTLRSLLSTIGHHGLPIFIIVVLLLMPHPVGASSADSGFHARPGEWGESWSTLPRTRVGDQEVLGPLGEQAIALRLTELGQHEYIRLRLRIQLVGWWHDQGRPGLMTIRTSNGTEVFNATITQPPRGVPRVPNHHQSYPGLATWESFPGGTGAAETRGEEGNPHSPSAVYELEVSFRHESPDLTLMIEARDLGEDDRWVILDCRIDPLDARPVDEADLENFWEELGRQTYRLSAEEVGRVVRGGETSRRFLTRMLSGRIDQERIQELIAQLNDARFRVRESATMELIALGESIRPELERAIESNPPLETRERISEVLEEIGQESIPASEYFRIGRALTVVSLMELPGETSLLSKISTDGATRSVRQSAQIMMARRLDDLIGHELREVRRVIRSGDYDRADAHLREMLDNDRLEDRQREIITGTRTMARQLAELNKQFSDTGRIDDEALGDPPAPEAMAIWVGIDLDRVEDALAIEGLGEESEYRKMLRSFDALRSDRPTSAPAELHAAMLRELKEFLTDLDLPAPNELAGINRVERLAELADMRWRRHAETLTGDSVPDASLSRVLREVNRLANDDLRLGLGWTNALAAIRSDRMGAGGIRGRWQLNDQGLIVSQGDFSTYALPNVRFEHFELMLQFKRREGNDGIYIGLPLPNGRRCNLNLGGWGNSVSGLEWIDGNEVIGNPTAVRPSGIRNAVSHRLLVRVKAAENPGHITIEAVLDGQSIINWSGDPARLTRAAAWPVTRAQGDAEGVILGAHQSEVVFSEIRMRAIERQDRRNQD